MNIFFILLN
jgi:hypothetical protein